ncbi:MAG: hypothetical protein CMA30_02630 [Euryarchaeota archaeon]|nr:hypothetical protein [Euryarchaeota archaeon]|tara:strand:+ start:963 stop:1583 length:621 start_codon:yes stop_codon:yes gene_type:complete
MTPKFDDAYRYRTGRPRAEDAHIWKQIEAYVKARIEEGYTRDQIRDELRQRIKEKLGRDDLPINYTYINKIQRKYNLKLTKRNKWQKPGYTDASVDHRYKPKTEGVDHDVKADGQPICPNCIRERPCSNCPNVLPTIADMLNMEYRIPINDKPFFRAEKNNHMIWIEDGFLNYKHEPSGSSSKIHIKDWKKVIEPLNKAINTKLEF